MTDPRRRPRSEHRRGRRFDYVEAAEEPVLGVLDALEALRYLRRMWDRPDSALRLVALEAEYLEVHGGAVAALEAYIKKSERSAPHRAGRHELIVVGTQTILVSAEYEYFAMSSIWSGQRVAEDLEGELRHVRDVRRRSLQGVLGAVYGHFAGDLIDLIGELMAERDAWALWMDRSFGLG